MTDVWPGPPVAPPSDGLARAVRIMLGLVALASFILLFSNLRAASAFRIWWESPPSGQQGALDDWLRVDNGVNSWSIIFMVAWATTVILVMVWTNRAHKHLQWARPGDRRWSSGWTVGGWFIPIANVAIPRLVLNELERVGRPPSPLASDSSRSLRPARILASGMVWWISFLVVWFLHSIGAGMVSRAVADEYIEYPGTVSGGYLVGAIAALVGIVAGITGFNYFKRFHAELKAAEAPVHF